MIVKIDEKFFVSDNLMAPGIAIEGLQFIELLF